MELLLKFIMGLGGLTALVAGGWLYLFGDPFRAKAEREGRPRPVKAMSPEAERRYGLVMALVGAAFILLLLFV
jgi:hypothetical protein